MSVSDKLLGSYPDAGGAEKITEALAVSSRMDYAKLKADADIVKAWLKGKSEADVKMALKGEGTGPVADIAKAAKADEFWLYSRFFGIGLITAMEEVGVEPSPEAMESWIGDAMGKMSLKSVTDLGSWNEMLTKLNMMSTLMKEIEIREKKKMAERLEDKAKAAMKRQEREEKSMKLVDDNTN